MSPKHSLPILVVAALGLSACGGSSEEDQVRDVVKESVKTPTKLCDNLAAPALKTLGGEAKCKALAKDQDGQDIKITSVDVKGDKATVKGTGKDGKDAGTLNLVKEDGDWKISIAA